MLVVGIDPSSSKCGIALVETDDGSILATWLWEKDKRASSSANLFDYYRWLGVLLSSGDPARKVLGGRIAPMASIEFLGVERNAQTTRLISHFQAASVLACKQTGMMVIEGRTSSARKAALGRGNLSKDEAWEMVKKMYPNHKFRAKTSGGTDEMDAVVMALAAPTLAEL